MRALKVGCSTFSQDYKEHLFEEKTNMTWQIQIKPEYRVEGEKWILAVGFEDRELASAYLESFYDMSSEIFIEDYSIFEIVFCV